jgi:hypothetical protein
MNPNEHTPDVNRTSGAAVGFAIASVMFVVLGVIVKLSLTVPPVDAARSAIISQSLYEIRTNELTQLNSPGWVDKPRGIVRLPIETAMQLAAQEWQNPAQARADLIARAKKSTAPAPKVANPYE